MLNTGKSFIQNIEQVTSRGSSLLREKIADVLEHALEAAEFAFAIIRTASDALTDIIHNPDKHEDPITVAQRKADAAQTAVERVLGAPSGSLPLVDEETMMAWFAD